MRQVPGLDEVVSNDYGSLVAKKLERAINGDDYVCEEPTLIESYVDSLFASIADDIDTFFYLYFFLAPDFWVFYAILAWGVESTDFYPNKQQGQVYNKAFRDLKAFWGDSYPDGIALQALSMNILITQKQLILEVIVFFFGVESDGAEDIYDEALDLLEANPAIGFDFPLWTLNAFAYDTSDLSPEDWPFPNFGAGIAMGDGIVSFLEDIGYGDGGPEYVLFHEFGHQVQFGSGVFDSPPFDNDPENTRRTELMADALAAYYGHHPRGATFQTKRVEAMSESAFAVGDCFYDSPGHHGTPNQRAKAVKFATDLVDEKGGKGKIRLRWSLLPISMMLMTVLLRPTCN